ncbi:hypothetical protein BDZ94DRAFT_1261362 [Collybia nuda]|uniref:Uncharacterized protein n=1 Tax=Collybia nuda TaxID=64659 RepID=A0A9P5Y352_9AGAR|nr:hypothetical protein BDZ94DRAFT_1261362 [Collybia nuda]
MSRARWRPSLLMTPCLYVAYSHFHDGLYTLSWMSMILRLEVSITTSIKSLTSLLPQFNSMSFGTFVERRFPRAHLFLHSQAGSFLEYFSSELWHPRRF